MTIKTINPLVHRVASSITGPGMRLDCSFVFDPDKLGMRDRKDIETAIEHGYTTRFGLAFFLVGYVLKRKSLPGVAYAGPYRAFVPHKGDEHAASMIAELKALGTMGNEGFWTNAYVGQFHMRLAVKGEHSAALRENMRRIISHHSQRYREVREETRRLLLPGKVVRINIGDNS